MTGIKSFGLRDPVERFFSIFRCPVKIRFRSGIGACEGEWQTETWKFKQKSYTWVEFGGGGKRP